jgi:hypothetical protein
VRGLVGRARESGLAVVVSTQQLPCEPLLRKALLGAGALFAQRLRQNACGGVTN